MGYNELMTKIHNDIIKMRTVMKEERARIKKESNPMEDDQKDKVSIPTKLTYAEEGEALKQFEIRAVR